MADVFISYSRQDEDFVRQLHHALEQHKAWVDWADIPPTAEWQKEILANIERAANFIFVISPDSVVSLNCRREIEHAEANHKRMVPILYRSVADNSIPESIGKYQRIDFRDERSFGPAFDLLVNSLETDLVETRKHARLLVRANEWEQAAEDSSFLLRGEDLLEGERWMANSAERGPRPTPLHSRYVWTSRQTSLDSALREPAAQPVSPLDLPCRDRLQTLLDQALTGPYETAETEIRRRLSRVCSRAALKAQLAPDHARLGVTVFPDGSRIGVGYRDRLVIADATSFEPFFTHPLDPAADRIRMKADPLLRDTIFAAVRPERTSSIRYYGIPVDGSGPNHLGTKSPSLFQKGQDTLLEELVRQFANRTVKAELRFPAAFWPRLRLQESFRAKDLRVPLIVASDGKIGLWLALDELTGEKQSVTTALLSYSARPVLKMENGEIVEIAPGTLQRRFLQVGVDPLEPVPLEAIYEVAALDVRNRVAAVRDRLVSFHASGTPVPEQLPFTLKNAVSAEFNADATELLVQQKDGSLDVYDVAGHSVTHRFPAVAGARCVALGPRQESALVVHADGRLECWDLKAFAPDGSAVAA